MNKLIPWTAALGLISVPACSGEREPAPSTPAASALPSAAAESVGRADGSFVPNLGQWDVDARFVYRSEAMTLLLRDRGWVVDLQPPGTRRAVACQMTFEGGDAVAAHPSGEAVLPGRHSYFLGSDPARWRTDVPRYASVLYSQLYPGIDLRLRTVAGVPEYDLLLQPGADLAAVRVHVEGARGVQLGRDGALHIDTELGPLTQPMPTTWEIGPDGERRPVACAFVRLGEDRFGFRAPAWSGTTALTIDPGLIWSTYLGGGSGTAVQKLEVRPDGILVLAGATSVRDFPTTLGAYDRSYSGIGTDVFVSLMDPTLPPAAQLVYATYLGGDDNDAVGGLDVGADGVITVAGTSSSRDFPTTATAFDPSPNGAQYDIDGFVARLDLAKQGVAQLAYSTYLGGTKWDQLLALHVGAGGIVTVGGWTYSPDFPTSSGAYDQALTGRSTDGFLSQLDLRKAGAAQLVYSTYLGPSENDAVHFVEVDAAGVMTIVGWTESQFFPTTPDAYDRTFHGSDLVLCRLDPRRVGAAQLGYSSFFGGSASDQPCGYEISPSGILTICGRSYSPDLPTTIGAWDRTKGGTDDVFVARFDLGKVGAAQLLYSTYLGGGQGEVGCAVSVDEEDVVTVVGSTFSNDFPTTPDAFARTGAQGAKHDCFAARLDLRRSGAAQLVYSTYLGGPDNESVGDAHIDPVGVVTLGGRAGGGLPTTPDAFRRMHPGTEAGFVSRLGMGIPFVADRYELSVGAPGSRQSLSLEAGSAQAGRLYRVFGSMTGTSPGVRLGGVHIPLVPDLYTDWTLASAGLPPLSGFRGVLDATGSAAASFVMPSLPPAARGITLHHAFLVYDAAGRWYRSSNPVPLRLVR